MYYWTIEVLFDAFRLNANRFSSTAFSSHFFRTVLILVGDKEDGVASKRSRTGEKLIWNKSPIGKLDVFSLGLMASFARMFYVALLYLEAQVPSLLVPPIL